VSLFAGRVHGRSAPCLGVARVAGPRDRPGIHWHCIQWTVSRLRVPYYGPALLPCTGRVSQGPFNCCFLLVVVACVLVVAVLRCLCVAVT
jgi:hypothetical protein